MTANEARKLVKGYEDSYEERAAMITSQILYAIDTEVSCVEKKIEDAARYGKHKVIYYTMVAEDQVLKGIAARLKANGFKVSIGWRMYGDFTCPIKIRW